MIESEDRSLFPTRGFSFIVGVDEVGRGCLAGDVVSSAVCFYDFKAHSEQKREDLVFLELPVLKEVRDSKLLSEETRAQIFDRLFPSISDSGSAHYSSQRFKLAAAVGSASVREIDQYNILQATFLSMVRCVHRVSEEISKNSGRIIEDHKLAVLIDGKHPISAASLKLFANLDKRAIPPFTSFPQIKADQVSLSVALASVLAKVTRDRDMQNRAAKDFPGYFFEKHKGYGTKSHLDALAALGVSPLHRKSFSPVRALSKSSS